MSFQKDISELLLAKVITQETADKINDYYNSRNGRSQNRLLIIFGLLGALLVGLGLILIIAHNWDEMSVLSRTMMAFSPLIIGQGLCGWLLLQGNLNNIWKESASVFLFLAVGATIALISQLYNMGGELSDFVLVWMLLCFPLMFVMESSMASIMYLIGVNSYSLMFHSSMFGYNKTGLPELLFYWVLLLPVLYFYYLLYRNKPDSSSIRFHHWLVPLSVIALLSTFMQSNEQLMFVAYICLFGLYFLIGNDAYFQHRKLHANAYVLLGSLGSLGCLFALSFDEFWSELLYYKNDAQSVSGSSEFIASVLLFVLTSVYYYFQKRRQAIFKFNPLELVYVLFTIIFIIGNFSVWAVVLINLLVLLIGIATVRQGALLGHLGILNVGLFIITTLITCRFFDTDLSFVTRGILFVCIGAGFFIANFMILKKRKANEQK